MEILINKQIKVNPQVLNNADFIYCMNGVYLDDKRVINNNLRLQGLADDLVEEYKTLIIDSYVPEFNALFKSNKYFLLSTLGSFRSELSDGFNNFCNLHLIKELIKELKVERIVFNGFTHSEIIAFNHFDWSSEIEIASINNAENISYSIVLRNIFYYCNIFIFVLLLKFFKQKKLKPSIEDVVAVFPPNHFDKSNSQHAIYDLRKKTLFALIITDGAYSPVKIKSLVTNYKKISRLNNVFINDHSITLTSIGLSFIKSFEINRKIDLIKKSVERRNPFISYLTLDDIISSKIQLNRLLFLENSISKSIEQCEFSTLHTYLFEYNIGRLLCSLAIKNNIEAIGYQHGSISRLKILNINTPFYVNEASSYNPNTIYCFGEKEQNEYIRFKYTGSKFRFFKTQNDYLLVSKQVMNAGIQNINLVICGLHDQNELITFCKNNLNNHETTLRLHPRARILKNQLNNIKFQIDQNVSGEESIMSHQNIYVTYSTLGIYSLKNNKNTILILLNGLISQSPILGNKRISYA